MPSTVTVVLSAALLVNLAAAGLSQEGMPMASDVPEQVYKTDLIAFPGPWRYQLPRAGIILVSDQELEALSDPDRVLDLSTSYDKREESLRQVCERAQARGAHTLVIAFDQFFRQYRPGQDTPRKLMPDMPEYINRMAEISKFAAQYGLGLELSLLSPLEIGPAYRQATGESGVWLHYREGLRDPKTGAFSVQLWRHQRWCNNKGPIDVEDAGVRVFAFAEHHLGGTPYYVVDPRSIREISDVARVQVYEGQQIRHGDFHAVRIRVYGEGHVDLGSLNRVLVVQVYHTPEMDYFSDKAYPFLRDLIDKYADAGVKLNGLYSDEMHIQQDWAYHAHHDHGEFALRYVSPGLQRRYAELYGEQYRDMAKYMVYFCQGQHDWASDLTAKQETLHVFGSSPRQIRETALFRARYYHLLQDGVVDLFVKAKRHAEQRMGHKLDTRAHATWAESPTCDYWDTGPVNSHRSRYEYTSNFVWSNTVHQAASACYDYFKWGDYLTGNGNDHAEGGFLDRDYFGLALACSTGILNEVPHSYAAHWGMPAAIAHRRNMLCFVYGTGGLPFAAVEDMQHRDVSVMMLYPLDLVAVNERFGSWMTQYGYANMITAAKLLERGKVVDGALEVAGRRFTTLATTFEPFPSEKLLAMMRHFVEAGGRLIWSGPPPVLTAEGTDALSSWCDLFGVEYRPGRDEGLKAPGWRVTFEGKLAGVASQVILTDFLVDHIYPVAPREGTRVVARAKQYVIGTYRPGPAGGSATFLGYRPRDDQSASLGYETRNWFEVLNALGAYPPSGRFEGVNDNTEYLSRTGEYLMCRFPNGAVAITRHLRDLEEDWPGGFARDRAKDDEYIKQHPLPSDEIDLRDFKVNGHSVTYHGRGAMAFRLSGTGELVAFAGYGCRGITIDGRQWVFADQGRELGHVAWAPVAAARRVPGGAVFQFVVHGTGELHLPRVGLPERFHLVREGPTPGSKGPQVPFEVREDRLVVPLKKLAVGRWIYVVPDLE